MLQDFYCAFKAETLLQNVERVWVHLQGMLLAIIRTGIATYRRERKSVVIAKIKRLQGHTQLVEVQGLSRNAGVNAVERWLSRGRIHLNSITGITYGSHCVNSN